MVGSASISTLITPLSGPTRSSPFERGEKTGLTGDGIHIFLAVVVVVVETGTLNAKDQKTAREYAPNTAEGDCVRDANVSHRRTRVHTRPRPQQSTYGHPAGFGRGSAEASPVSSLMKRSWGLARCAVKHA